MRGACSGLSVSLSVGYMHVHFGNGSSVGNKILQGLEADGLFTDLTVETAVEMYDHETKFELVISVQI